MTLKVIRVTAVVVLPGAKVWSLSFIFIISLTHTRINTLLPFQTPPFQIADCPTVYLLLVDPTLGVPLI